MAERLAEGHVGVDALGADVGGTRRLVGQQRALHQVARADVRHVPHTPENKVGAPYTISLSYENSFFLGFRLAKK